MDAVWNVHYVNGHRLYPGLFASRGYPMKSPTEPFNRQQQSWDCTKAFQSWVYKQCLSILNEPCHALEPLWADGSNRRFFRVRAEGRTLIALCHPDGRPCGTGENDAFVGIANHLKDKEVRVPSIYAYERDLGWIILQDLGNLSLQQAVLSASSEEEILDLYKPVLDLLLDLQVLGPEGFQDDWCYQGSKYDMDLMLERESGYFLRAFLKSQLKDYDEQTLQNEFLSLARMASDAPGYFLVHRDFQSRNILLPSRDMPYVIDFQGARRGPLQYDVAALIVDPYVPLSRNIRGKVLNAYLQRLDASGVMGREQFVKHYPVIGLHRNLQILGAYAFLGHVKRKPFFLQWIPSALTHLHSLLENHPEWPCPHLRQLVAEVRKTL